jgi:hypothetical protein
MTTTSLQLIIINFLVFLREGKKGIPQKKLQKHHQKKKKKKKKRTKKTRKKEGKK